MAENYVIVKLAVQEPEAKKALENPGAEGMMATWGGADAALPFYVFLNGEGSKIADSNAMPDGSNIGFPGTREEVEAFGRLLERTAPRLDTAQRASIVEYLMRRIPK